MGIAAGPQSLEQWKHFQREYEARHMAYSPEGHQLASLCLRDVVKLSILMGARWAFRQLMIATFDPAVREKLAVAASYWYSRVAARATMTFTR